MSEIFESIQVSDEVKRFVDHSFDIVNRIHDILENQGKTQRDLATLMGKKESEISKWMQGTHNFTLKSLAKIESVLGEKLIVAPKINEVLVKKEVLAFFNQHFEWKTALPTQNTPATEKKNSISIKVIGETVSKNNTTIVDVSNRVEEYNHYLEAA